MLKNIIENSIIQREIELKEKENRQRKKLIHLLEKEGFSGEQIGNILDDEKICKCNYIGQLLTNSEYSRMSRETLKEYRDYMNILCRERRY